MSLKTEFNEIKLSELPALSKRRKEAGWRFVQILAVTTPDGFDLVYSFMKNGLIKNSEIKNLTKDDVVPSITGEFFSAFVFENEIHDLFGIQIKDIVIDFGGNFYKVSQKEPMSILSPAQAAARKAAAKPECAPAPAQPAPVAAEPVAQAALEEKPSKASKETSSAIDADMEAKLAAMDPEKAAKLRTALEAKAARAQQKAGE